MFGSTRLAATAAVALLLSSGTAYAGPPYMTDDPEPTDTGHWEIFAPLMEAGGRGRDFAGVIGAEINYGPVKDVQLTLGIPLDYSHDATGYKSGMGDLELSVKYRFYHNEEASVQIAVFPGTTLPTGHHDFTAGHVTALLPVWAQKDSGPWSIFGGGGYAINPGAGNKNFWTGGIAVTRQLSEKFSLGVEVNRSGASEVGGDGSTSLGLGTIIQLPKPFRLLASGGSTFEDHGGGTSFHAFLALGLDF